MVTLRRRARGFGPWWTLAVVSALLAPGCSSRAPADAEQASRRSSEQASRRSEDPSHGTDATRSAPVHERSPIQLPDERRLTNVQMLTDGGENAEAYWSWDGRRLIFQARRDTQECDRILVMNADGTDERLLARHGANTCAYFLRDDQRIVFSSTRTAGRECPPRPDHSQGYVWPVHESYEIYSARPDGSDVQRLTHSPGYDAEATVSPDGRIVFTSVRDGDLDIYLMESDGTNVRRLTNEPGYDGGPFFSPDGSRIVYRAWHPQDPAELAEHRSLLAKGLVRPGRLDIWVMNADGSDQRQVTSLGAASFAPSFLPDGQSVIFSSNHDDPRGRNFDLYVVDLQGRGLERVTWNGTFDGFPLFSPDGSKLVFCSNRGNAKAGETNIFVADWTP